MTLRVLSLFSGAGGSDLALEAAGMSVAALCEIEPHARAVLREHWPDAELHGDVSELDGTQYRGKVDIVVGGSPCQDLSVAGKRAGLTEGSGTRSSLFYEQVRIWNESDAPYLIWENVKGAFSSSQGADFAAVLSAIVGRPVPVRRDGWSNAGVVCGPTAVAAWRLLDLQHFGVPQRRERIVVLAARSGGVDPAEVLAVSQSLRWDSAPRFEAREGVARDVAPRPDRQSALAIDLYNQSISVNGVTHTIRAMNAGEGIPHTLTYDARGNGNGVVANTLAGDHQNRVTDYTALVVDKQGAGVSQHIAPTLKTDLAHQMGPVVLGEQATAFHLTQDPINGNVSPAFGTTSNGMGVIQAVAETIVANGDAHSGFRDEKGLVIDIPQRTLAFKVRGGVEVDSAGKTAGKGYLGSEEVAFTLSGTQDQQIHQGIAPTITMGAHPAAPGLNGQDAAQFAEALISAQPGVPRRLMPIECERLMGWGDDWTRWGMNEKGKRYELADTPRYKLCGNGIGREWMEWVGLRLMEAEGLTASSPSITLDAVAHT